MDGSCTISADQLPLQILCDAAVCRLRVTAHTSASLYQMSRSLRRFELFVLIFSLDFIKMSMLWKVKF